MIKYFCDICGKELKKSDCARLSGSFHRLAFKVAVALDGDWNAGDVCHDCIRHAIICSEEAEDRESSS